MIDDQMQTDTDSDHRETDQIALVPAVLETALFDTACRALSEACAVDEVKDILDQALKLKSYAKLAGSKEMERKAAMIRLRAERRLGEMMMAQAEMVGKAKGGQPHQRRAKATGVSVTPVAPTLDEAGIDKNLAKRARMAANLPEREFEDRITEVRDGKHDRFNLRRSPQRVPRSSKPARSDRRNHDAVRDDGPTLPAGAEAVSDQPDPDRSAQSEGADQHSLTMSFTGLEFSQVATLAEQLGMPADAVVRRALAELVANHCPSQDAQSGGGLDG